MDIRHVDSIGARHELPGALLESSRGLAAVIIQAAVDIPRVLRREVFVDPAQIPPKILPKVQTIR